MINIHSTHPESREKLERLANVPVDELYAERLKALLEAHGAKMTLTEMKHYPPDGSARWYFLYTIDFPEGTYREYGMQLVRSIPFTISFPDGFTQPGTEVYRVSAGLDEPPTVLLYLRK